MLMEADQVCLLLFGFLVGGTWRAIQLGEAFAKLVWTSKIHKGVHLIGDVALEKAEETSPKRLVIVGSISGETSLFVASSFLFVEVIYSSS